MKIFKLFAATVVASMALTSCSNEIIEDVTTSSSNAIGFKAVTIGSSNSRATAIDASNLTDYSFDVFAFTPDGKSYLTHQTTGWYADGVEIKYNVTKWDYVVPEELAYWPAVSLDFYAVYPAHVDKDRLAWNMASGKDNQQISHLIADEFGAETAKHDNYDVMYGVALGQTKDTNGGTVKFNFKHTLSQVLFKAKTANASLEVEVQDIKLLGSYVGGIFTIPEGTADATYKNWAPTTWAEHLDAREKNQNTIVNSTQEAVWLSAADNAMFTMPAELTAWNPATDGNATTACKSIEKGGTQKTVLAINCKIKQNGQYLDGFSADKYTTVYVPFGETFQPGKRYVYTLIFGGGYTDDGKQVLQPILFDAEVTDWVNETGKDVAM